MGFPCAKLGRHAFFYTSIQHRMQGKGRSDKPSRIERIEIDIFLKSFKNCIFSKIVFFCFRFFQWLPCMVMVIKYWTIGGIKEKKWPQNDVIPRYGFCNMLESASLWLIFSACLLTKKSRGLRSMHLHLGVFNNIGVILSAERHLFKVGVATKETYDIFRPSNSV